MAPPLLLLNITQERFTGVVRNGERKRPGTLSNLLLAEIVWHSAASTWDSTCRVRGFAAGFFCRKPL